MDIKSISKLFIHGSLEDYVNIVEQCDSQIQLQQDNAAAYYFRAMAKMGVAVSLKMNNKLLLNAVPLGITGGLGITGSTAMQGKILRNKINKIEEHYKIADSAVEDYNKALFLDSNIQRKYNNIKVKATSDLTGASFIFHRPISSKELLDLLAGNRKWTLFIIPLAFLFILPFILLYFDNDGTGNVSNRSAFILIAYTLGLVIYVLFANNKDKKVLQKYSKDIIVIKKASNNEGLARAK